MTTQPFCEASRKLLTSPVHCEGGLGGSPVLRQISHLVGAQSNQSGLWYLEFGLRSGSHDLTAGELENWDRCRGVWDCR